MRAPRRLLLAATILTAPAALAQPAGPTCVQGQCSVRLTPDNLLTRASALVMERRFDEARPLVAALAAVPALRLETHFLAGYIAVETGDLDTAIGHFRAALAADPKQTRVRLELARTMMLKGRDGAADYHFRLAEDDDGLPPEILATIRSSRGLLRDRRPWHLTAEIGIAPDTNITGGTSAETVGLLDGDRVLDFRLEGNARARSGIGQTARLAAGWRFKLDDRAALLVDVDGQGVNYEGESVDDYTAQAAVGPELALTEDTRLSLQGTALQRWYGGQRAATQYGGRLALQRTLDAGQRIGLTLDARHSDSGFSPVYDGWSLGAYATYERVVARSMIASASVFARTDRLRETAYSNREYGVALGLGGELAHGINAGISANVSRATYEAALARLSPDPRADWRLSGRLYAGLRSLRVLGFSPSVSYSFARNASSLALYDSARSRFAFNLARYF